MPIQTTSTDIHLRSSQAMGLSALTPFSVSTWINANWSAGARDSFVGIYGPSVDTPLGTPITALQIGSSTGAGELSCWTWGGAVLVGTATGAMTAFNNTWVFVVYAFDGTTHSLYRNGVLVASATTTQTPGFLNQVYINGYPTGITNEVSAFQVDQYALFRRALSADEVQTMYAAQGGRHGIVKDVICSYDFDELAQDVVVSSVVDMSGNGHTLTIAGAGTSMTYVYPSALANSNTRPVQ